MKTAATLSKSTLAALYLVLGASQATATCYRGVNLAGAEFGELGGSYGQSYTYPSPQTITYFADKGFNTIRLPFRWERLQPIPGTELDIDELNRIRATVEEARNAGLNVILDVHNYAKFTEKPIGSSAASVADFADLWSRIASAFANQPDVTFGLMNEPTEIKTEVWLEASNAAIAAIRKAGANNLILVPGTSWTGAHSWFSTTGDGNNSEVMTGVKDPASNYAYEFHQYLDSNFSGTHDSCPRSNDAVQALKDVSAWLRSNNARGFVGEFGGSADNACIAGIAKMVDYLNSERDVWTGWTYWAGGDWWPASEPLNIQPVDGKDRPQLKALLRPGLDDDTCGGM